MKAARKHHCGLVRLLYLEVKCLQPKWQQLTLCEVKRPLRQISKGPCEGAKEVKDE